MNTHYVKYYNVLKHNLDTRQRILDKISWVTVAGFQAEFTNKKKKKRLMTL